MIFDGQNEMHNTLKELNRKLDELMGRQEMVLSRVSQLTGGNVQVAQVKILLVYRVFLVPWDFSRLWCLSFHIQVIITNMFVFFFSAT